MATERFVIQPASDTKELSVLRHPLNLLDSSWHVASLSQRSGSHPRESPQSANAGYGTTLWLSSQLLALYLTDLYGHGSKKQNRKLKAVELGSGIGLAALVLASDVVATDLPVVISQVLEKNIETHLELIEMLVACRLPRISGIEPGKIDVKVRDWTVDIFLSLERRDVGVVDGALQQARELGFACEMIRTRKLTKLMKKAGVFCTAEPHQEHQSGRESCDELLLHKINQQRRGLGL